MTRRKAAVAALNKLWHIDPNLSEDDDMAVNEDDEPEEGDDSTTGCSSSNSDSDLPSEEGNETDLSAKVLSPSSSIPSTSSAPSGSQLRLRGKCGTVWKQVSVNAASSCGRKSAENVFCVTTGIKPFARNKIDSPLSAWRMLV